MVLVLIQCAVIAMYGTRFGSLHTSAVSEILPSASYQFTFSISHVWKHEIDKKEWKLITKNVPPFRPSENPCGHPIQTSSGP